MYQQATGQEPKGAPALRILARAMIRDYANFSGSRLASWKASHDVQKAIKAAVARGGLSSDPAARDFLVQELTVRLADLSLRLTESAKVLAQELGDDSPTR
ncbi:hypothetical protein [Streptomyces sp. NPDC050564]|uniref:hypothetical protein n=1 Tax=Streptomyces sp. NPDC050564 TaxID=3365631 RepID=UPI0037AC8B68